MSAEPKTDRGMLASILGKKSGVEKNEPKSPSRKGEAPLTTWHDPAVLAQLRAMAFEQNKSQKKLASEAFNLLFAKYGKPQIS